MKRRRFLGLAAKSVIAVGAVAGLSKLGDAQPRGQLVRIDQEIIEVGSDRWVSFNLPDNVFPVVPDTGQHAYSRDDWSPTPGSLYFDVQSHELKVWNEVLGIATRDAEVGGWVEIQIS